MKNLITINEPYLSIEKWPAAGRGLVRNVSTILFVTFIWLMAAQTASAQSGLSLAHPNLAPGSGSDKAMERYQWDGVNLFNGNLNLPLTLGIRYPLAGEFGYQFSLTYNSNAWDFEQTSTTRTAMPVKNSSAGFGWDLSFGRLKPPMARGTQTSPWVYISPDGSLHPFYSTLHYDVSESDPGDTTLYTRDSTYYRMRIDSADQVLVEAPDGTQSLFRLQGGEWKLARINDRFGNNLSFTYSASLMTLTDNHGRVHRVYFRADPSYYYGAVVDRIEMAAFNGTTATYTLSYTVASVARPDVDNDPATSASLNLPLLAGVTHPDGSKHSFTYHASGAGTGWSGRLASMQLPTRGKIEWTYQPYRYTTGVNPTSLAPISRHNVGVATRRMVSTDGVVDGVWTYTLSLQSSGSEESEMTNTVQTPLGDKSVYYFSVNTQSLTAQWSRSDYALPFTKNQADATGARHLSSQIFDCDTGGNNCQLIRSTYVSYEQDQATDPSSPEVASVNRRQTSSRTVYHDDVENGEARFADTDRANFDGLGHFRRLSTSGNFGSADVRSYFVNYDAATGTYPSSGYVMPSPSQPWLPGLVGVQRITEGNSSQVVEFCYDRSNGFLLRRRQWATTSPTGTRSPVDLVTVFTPHPSGQVMREQYYGGDVQPLEIAPLCSLVVPPTDQYRVQHTYQFGSRASTQFYTSSGAPTGPKYIDKTIDRNTGMASATRDSSGISTTYEYDAMGRQTWVKPEAGHGAWKQINYVVAVPGDYAKKATYEKANGGGAVLTYDADVYDSFGRVWWQQTALPGSYPNRYSHYNALGLLTYESEFSNDAPRYTEYLNYDPLGRPRTVRPPDGAHHDINYQYAGVRRAVRTATTGLMYYQSSSQVVEGHRSKTEVYDRQGRLWKEVTQTLDGSPDLVKVNTYDVADRLVQTTDGNGVLIGSRLAYDGRGFLIGATYASGNSPHFTNYDARGNALTRRLAVTDLTFTFDRAGRLTKVSERNNAERVWKEFTYADSNGVNDWRAGKLIEAKRYNRMDELGGPSGGVAIVTETFAYGGKAGRLSSYNVALSDGAGLREQFSQSYTYTDLGKVERINYPSIVFAGGENVSRARTVTNNYAVGWLSSVNGTLNSQSQFWANSINYHPNKIVSQVAHSNGVTDNFTNDPNGFARVASVFTTGVQKQSWQSDQNLYSGDFQYDGNQSLVRIGANFFLPRYGQQAPPPGEPSGYTPACQGGWTDPFGLSKASTPDGSCFPTVLSYYTASDALLKEEDRIGNTRTWYFYDTSGRKLMDYRTGLTTGTWHWLKDYIYRGGLLLAAEEIVKGSSAPKKYHFHIGAGVRGIHTDANGFRIEPLQ